MPRRGAMWPTELAYEAEFVSLTPLAQWLFQRFWLHPNLDSGGFLPLQVDIWSKAASELTPMDVEGMLDELLAGSWVSVDDDTGELWVSSFIELDTCRKPNMFIAAMRAAQTCQSKALRQKAWAVIDRLYHEIALKPPGDDADEKAWKTHRSAVEARDDQYEKLRDRVVREPPSVGEPVGGEVLPANAKPSNPQSCSRCGRRPAMQRGLCGACLGRELQESQ
ncbi:MAG: hypothetical protein QOG19_2859 [Mycobacterium sp.]|nr:hypothetical protein [Mycobacterium sp.]